jgi:hypothetical protein
MPDHTVHHIHRSGDRNCRIRHREMEEAFQCSLFVDQRGGEMSTRDAYKKKLEAEIELAQAKLVELKARAKVSAADVRIKYEKSIDHLERMLDVTKTKLGELGSSSEDAWGDLRSGVESAWADFKTGLGDAAAKFRS